MMSGAIRSDQPKKKSYLCSTGYIKEMYLTSDAKMAEPESIGISLKGWSFCFTNVMQFNVGVNIASSLQRFERREQLQGQKKK